MSHELVRKVVAQAMKLGATQAEAACGSAVGFDVCVRMGDIESVEYHKSDHLGVTVYFGKRFGAASTSDFSESAVRLTVEKACYIARFTEHDPCVGLAKAELLAYDYPNLDLIYPWTLSVDQAIELAKECESRAFAVDKRIVNSDGAMVGTISGNNIYANSHGFLGEVATSRHKISCELIAKQNDEMQRDYDYTVARDANDLRQPTEVAESAAKNTLQKLGARRISTRKTPVIFVPDVAKSLLGAFIKAISGRNLYRKATFLVDKMDEQIFPDFINIYEEPHKLKLLGSTPFDSEGVKTSKKHFAKDGCLVNYVLNSYSACKLGMETTGNAGGVYNLFIDTSTHDLVSLLKLMYTGLLVTDLAGQGVNIITGDYSRGVFGYWVENGEIKFPVHEVTIAGNLQNMFKNIVAVANDVDYRSNIITGSILIDGMTVAGD